MSINFAIAPINWSNDDDPNLGGEIPLEQCLDEMVRAGYQGCELGNKFPKNLSQLKKTVNHYGLQVCSDWIGTELTQKSRYNDTLEHFSRRVEFLRELGVKALKVCECGHSLQQSEKPIFSTKVRFSVEQWNALFAGLERMGEIANKAGMYVAYHQHLGTGVESEHELDRLMANTDPKCVTLLPDTGHLYAAGMNPVEIFDRYRERINYIHLKDVRKNILIEAKRKGYSFMDAVRAGMFSVPGDGCIDFAPIFKLLKKTNFSGWMVVEAEQDPKIAPPFLYARMARLFLKNHFGEIYGA